MIDFSKPLDDVESFTGNLEVEFTVKIFTDQPDDTEILDLYLSGFVESDNLIFFENFTDHAVNSVTRSNIDELKKYVATEEFPSLTTISDLNAAAFQTELTAIICGTSDFVYCQVEDGIQMKTGGIVKFSFTIYSTDDSDLVAKEIEKNVHNLPNDIILFDPQDLQEITVELTKIAPNDYAKFSTTQFIMIVTFSAIGILLIVGFIISGIVWRITMHRVITFLLCLVGSTLIAVLIYYAVIGDITWSLAGPIIGGTVVFVVIVSVMIDYCERYLTLCRKFGNFFPLG